MPRDLSVEPVGPRRVLILGECVAQWVGNGSTAIDCAHDFLLINNFTVLPDDPPRPVDSYDFQMLQIPMRSVLPEGEYLTLPYDDEPAWEELLERSCSRLGQLFESTMRYNTDHGLLTFVAGFLVPQQNPMGRLLPRDDPRNPVFVVEALNHELVRLIGSAANAYLLDLDQIAAGLGKQFIQDDVINAISHGGFLSNFDYARDQHRIEPPQALNQYFELRTGRFRTAVWAELEAMFRTVRQIDQVKLVVVDLDDTLWRGVMAEAGDRSDDTIEGWPMGIIEALQVLKKRGILLAIISKNDESKIEALWEEIFRGRLRLDDFVVRKINWRSKSDNLEEVLAELNLLSRSVVFVDDNPVERAEIAGSFPEVRVLGSELYQLRRLLLWAPETQVPYISDESARRTSMVGGQLARERERRSVPREEFLADLDVVVRLADVGSDDPGPVRRVLELLNKTNQFNTTGRRWTAKELQNHWRADGSVVGFEVRDTFTSYGLVGVVVIGTAGAGSTIQQVVMSCRVFGLDVEVAVLTEVIMRIGQTGRRLPDGLLEKTADNQPCWDLFQRVGYIEAAHGMWVPDHDRPPVQQFIGSIGWAPRAPATG